MRVDFPPPHKRQIATAEIETDRLGIITSTENTVEIVRVYTNLSGDNKWFGFTIERILFATHLAGGAAASDMGDVSPVCASVRFVHFVNLL